MTKKQREALEYTLEHLDELTPEQIEKLTAAAKDAINRCRDTLKILTGANIVLTLSENQTIAEQAKERLKRCTQIYKEIDAEEQEVTLKSYMNTLIYESQNEDIHSMTQETKTAFKEDNAYKNIDKAENIISILSGLGENPDVLERQLNTETLSKLKYNKTVLNIDPISEMVYISDISKSGQQQQATLKKQTRTDAECKVPFTIVFDHLALVGQGLNRYDEMVFNATLTIYEYLRHEYGDETQKINLRDIAAKVSKNEHPNAENLKQVYNSLLKLKYTRVVTIEEDMQKSFVKAAGSESNARILFRTHDDCLLDWFSDNKSYEINGAMTNPNTVITITRLPHLRELAEYIGQITTIDDKYLKHRPKAKANEINIHMYFIRLMCFGKGKTLQSVKVNLSTIAERTGLTTKQLKRVNKENKSPLTNELDWLSESGCIESYKIDWQREDPLITIKFKPKNTGNSELETHQNR